MSTSPNPTNHPDPSSTDDLSTTAMETNTMSDNGIGRTDDPAEFSDPTADPTAGTPADLTADTTADLTADPAATAGAAGLSSHLGWPEAPTRTTASASSASSSPVASEWTSPIPTSATREVPTARPFRVEPATPVPDDVVTEQDTERHPAASRSLPHLPPPAGTPVPTVSEPPQYAYRPPLVYVRRGPRPGAIMLGLLSMIVAGYVLAANLTNADLSFRLVGPPMIGAFGGMLLIVGLVGVVAGRMRR